MPKKNIKKVEFSAYKPYSQLVETMVNCDLPVDAVDYFYTSTNPRLIKYFPNFDEAMKYLSTNEGIVATTIEFKSKNMLKKERKTGKTDSQTHALCLVKRRHYYYLFDPNGPVMHYHDFKYIYNKLPYISLNFITCLCTKYNISRNNFIYEKRKPGIQFFAPDERNTEYITQGGYCMFYLYWFINYIAKNWSHKKICTIIKHKYSSSNSGIFPDKMYVPKQSKEVIKSIFATYPLIPSAICP